MVDLDQVEAALAKIALDEDPQTESPGMEAARAAVDEEAANNQVRELANIGSSMAEQMTGLGRGNRLSLDDTAKKRLLEMQAGPKGQDKTRALIEIFRQGSMDKRAKDAQDLRARGLDLGEDKLGWDKDKKSTGDQKDLSKQISSTGAAKLSNKANEFMSRLEKTDPQDIPGYGQGQSISRKMLGDNITDVFTSEEGRKLRGSFQDMLNEDIKRFAGSAATVAEVERVLKAVNQGLINSEEEFLDAMDRIYSTYEADINNTMSGFSPEAKKKYMAEGGTNLLKQVQDTRSRLTSFRSKRAKKEEKNKVIPRKESDLDNMSIEELEAYVNEGE